MRRRFLTFGFAVLAAAVASADDAPPTVTAKKEDVAFHVDLAGAFDAKNPVEVAFKPQVWTEEAEVEEAHAPGLMQAGELLVRFKTEKIDDAIHAAERDLGVAKATLAAQTEDQKRSIETTAAGVAKAEFDAKTARDVLDHFDKVEKPLRLEEADHELAGTQIYITDQTEELKQLEKMYKGDDLTEATEEIVLMRAKRQLDRTKKALDFQTRRDKVMREIALPRERESLDLDVRRTGAERDKTVAVTKLQETQSRLEVERTKANVEKQERDLAKLVADRAFFELKAPSAGWATPGTLLRGKWQNADDVKRALKKGGKFHPNDVLFTLVDTHAWRVATSVPEASLAWLRAGQEAKVVATQPGVKPWAARVAPMMPVTSGAEYQVELEPTGASEGLIGMTCKIRVETGKRTAILVPATAVEDAGFDKWVHVVGADGKAARRAVEIGQNYDDQTEVVSGLSEGEKVLVTAPKK